MTEAELKAAKSERSRQHYAKNAASILARQKAQRAINPEVSREANRKAYRKAPHKAVAFCAEYRARRMKARPPWVRRRDVTGMYAAARMFSYMLDEPFEVDHIVPLKGTAVCGLHVPWNLRICPRAENRQKGNNVSDQSWV